MKFLRAGLTALVWLSAVYFVRASSVIPLTTAENVQYSDAIFRGTVTAMSCFKDTNGLIHTRTSLRVDEPLKGTFPAVVQLVHRGGQVGNEDEFSGFAPPFQLGGEYLLFVKRGLDGRLFCTQGAASAVPCPSADLTLLDSVRALTQNGSMPGADVTDQAGQDGVVSLAAPTGLLGGVSSRFLQPDRGEPIPYLMDTDSLPAGISLTQATNAVRLAFSAWSAVTSLKFQFEGFQSFGQGADTITTDDQKIRIQLHDNYHSITATNVLGVGGRNSLTSPLPGTSWDLGGNVAGNEFRLTGHGYVVLASTNVAMQTLSTFTEVLCHEIGHALNMAHSSEVTTNDPVLVNSVMYFQTHADGRGATLGTYDPPVIDQMYPTNTPPFSYDRFLDVTTAANPPAVARINSVDLRGYDLQTTNLTLLTTNQSLLNGVFTNSGTLVKYTPNGFFGDTTRLDPAGTSYWDIVYARFSDGTNASPYVAVSVLSYNADSAAPSDGIPDNWMIQYFGNADPAVGLKHRATNDFDGDGLNNLQEYIAGSDPTSAASAQRITLLNTGSLSWQAKAYELYEVQESTNLVTWVRSGNPVVPTNATGTFSIPAGNSAQRFFRIQKVP